MSCSSCGGASGNKRVAQPQINIITNGMPNITMRQFIEELGWKYIGKCGCAENKSMFMNSEIPQWQIQISPNADRMQIWKIFNAVDKKQYGQAGPVNFREVYDYWINKSGDNLKIK